MAKKTKLQALGDVILGVNNGTASKVAQYQPTQESNNDIIFSTNSKDERDFKLKQMKQDRYMSYLWKKIGYDTALEQMPGATQVKIMYRDADMMAAWPEIGAALKTVSEEATTINNKGKILNIYSKSERIQAILEDLFVNRLDINIWSKTIIHELAKYGNEFMYLNINTTNGVMGWRELPVYEMTRIENGIQGLYGGYSYANADLSSLKEDDVRFVWEGHNQSIPFKSWQVAHFRLINDSLYLPMGVSWLNDARRHWRMLSMMEDGMLLYRLEKSVERRVYKVNVGLIDDTDVPAFLQEFMNTVKRAPIIDPQTGQVDLRKNFLDVTSDYVIPVRNGQDPTSIDVLQSNTNQTNMDDIKYMEGKILAALRVPKAFLNFQDSQNGGKAQNLSLLDIRFNRTINGIQQAFLMELNKIAIIHLFLLGFEDDLTNFTLSMNNPSNQIEMMELDNLTKRMAVAQTALAEQGGGLPLMSWHQVQKEIMGRSESEISDMLNDFRLEAALAMELQRTSEIITKTGLFNKTDRIYGDPGAKYSKNPPQGEGGPMGGGGGGPMGGGLPMDNDFGSGLDDLGGPMADEETDVGGVEGAENLENMSDNSLMEKFLLKNSEKNILKEFFNESVPIESKSLLINEEINSMIKELDNIGVETKK